MELYLLRHAEAVEPGAAGVATDAERPLTAEGERQMKRVAKGMHRLNLVFDLILSSPYVRAKQTAQIVAATLKAEEKFDCSDNLIGDANAAELIAELNRDYRQLRRILLVGHEPYLSRLMSTLLTGEPDLAINFKKASLAKLTVDSLRYGQCASLDWLLHPRLL